jgi:hypothetical protein
LCRGLGEKWQKICMGKRQRHRNAGQLAQQFSACSATVSTVLDSVNWPQYHFAHSKQPIDLLASIGLPRMPLSTVHALSGSNRLKMLITLMQDEMERNERRTAN